MKRLADAAAQAGPHAMLAVVAGAALAGARLLGATGGAGPPCISRLITHIPCPGCGLTRSFVAMWRGDPVLAFRYHPLGPPGFALCVLMVAVHLLALAVPHTRSTVDRACDALLGRAGMLLAAAALLGAWLTRVALAASGSRMFLW